jgi:protein gp37
MGKGTSIEWTDHTFNPWWGCARVSPGCEHCYAEAFSKRIGLKVWGANSDRRFFGDEHWDEPGKWNRQAEKAGRRRRVFCASMADVFEDRRDLDVHRDRLWRLIEATPWLDWLLLTKRPENHELVPLAWQTGSRRPTNVWLGTTAENQEYADRRIPELLSAPWPAVRFVSYEPALGAAEFRKWLTTHKPIERFEAFTSEAKAAYLVPPTELVVRGIDWVIVGGESGPGARPFDVAWARSTIEQCRQAGVACFVKQLGKKPFGVSMTPDCQYAICDAKGSNIAEWPPDLRVRQFPKTEPRCAE